MKCIQTALHNLDYLIKICLPNPEESKIFFYSNLLCLGIFIYPTIFSLGPTPTINNDRPYDSKNVYNSHSKIPPRQTLQQLVLPTEMTKKWCKCIKQFWIAITVIIECDHILIYTYPFSNQIVGKVCGKHTWSQT